MSKPPPPDEPRDTSPVWTSLNYPYLVRHRSGTYYLSAKIRSKKVRKSLQTTNLAAALARRDSLLAELRGAKRTTPRGSDAAALPTLGSALEHLVEDLSDSPNLKSSTRRYYRETAHAIRLVTPFLRLPWSQLTARPVTAWWSRIIEHNSHSRANSLLALLQRAIKVARAAGCPVPDHAFVGLRRLRGEHRRELRLPSARDFERIWIDIRDQHKRHSLEISRFVRFLAYSGLRMGELCRLRWEDITPREIIVSGGKEGAKSWSSRTVPRIPAMDALLQEMRAEYLDLDPAFPPRGQIFTIHTSRALTSACRRLGLPHLRNHDLRHLFATSCIEAGVDILTVAAWLGHKDKGALALRVYGHLRESHSRAAARTVRF